MILEEISKAEVKLGKNTGRVALNLFEYQEVIELSFNGHSSLSGYDQHCESLLQRLKGQIDNLLSKIHSRELVVQDIDLLLHEVASQEKRFFPKKSPEDWFLKLQFLIRHQKNTITDEIINRSILRYLKLQQRLLVRTKELLSHRTTYLRTSKTNISSQVPPSNATNPIHVSATGQVQMFEDNSYQTPLIWNRSSSDLLELVVALHRSQAISMNTGPILQKDLIELFCRFLNRPLKHTNQSISALKRRKKPESSYTLELHSHYRFYCEDE